MNLNASKFKPLIVWVKKIIHLMIKRLQTYRLPNFPLHYETETELDEANSGI